MPTVVAGLDIGSANIRLVIAEPGRDPLRPRILAQVKKESRGLRRGYVVNFDEAVNSIGKTVQEAERQIKNRLRNVFLSIGGITLEAKTSDGQVAVAKADQEISGLDLERARAASEANLGDFANRRILHSLPLNFKLDGKKIFGRPEGLKGAKLEIKTLFIHCLTKHLNDLVRATELAGLAVEDVVAAPYAASLPTLSTTQKAAGCLLANIGSQTTSLITFEEGRPVALQILPIGSNDVTNDIALGLRVSIEEAERIKLDPMMALNWKRKLDEIIEARLTDTFELIDAHLKKIGRSGLLPAGIVIVGGGADIPDLERLAKSNLRLPVQIFNPKESPWVVAYGLCLYGQQQEQDHSWQTKAIGLSHDLLHWFKDFWP